MAQVILANALLRWGHKTDLRTKWIGALYIPVGIGAFYFCHASKYNFHVGDIANLIYTNVSLDRLLLMAVYVLCIAGYAPWRRNIFRYAEHYVALFFLSLLALSFGIIAYYKINYVPGGQEFQLATRYFVNLAPVSTLVLVFATAQILSNFGRDGWMRFNIHVLICALIIMEYAKTCVSVMGLYQW